MGSEEIVARVKTPAFDRTLASGEDHAFAAALATEAGELLLALRGSLGFADDQHLRSQGDALSQKLLAARLGEERPGDAVLSEEADDDHARLSSRRVWIIDPLDGTREFGEEGRVDWAVHVALWVDGKLAAGAVALPAAGATYSTLDPPVRTRPAAASPRLVVSRTRPPKLVAELCEQIAGELVPMGSAGAKAMAVVSGEADAYVHTGGQYEWDSAAPVAVALASGLFASRIDGSPLAYNGRDAKLPDLVVCVPELAERLLEIVAPR